MALSSDIFTPVVRIVAIRYQPPVQALIHHVPISPYPKSYVWAEPFGYARLRIFEAML